MTRNTTSTSTNTIEITTDPTYGSLVDNKDGTVTFIPGGDQHMDSFQYRVKDDDGAWSKILTFTVFVTVVNEWNEKEMGCYARSDKAVLTLCYTNASLNICVRRRGYPTVGDDVGWNAKYPKVIHFEDDIRGPHYCNYEVIEDVLYYLFPSQKEVKTLHLGDQYQRRNRGRVFELLLEALGL